AGDAPAPVPDRLAAGPHVRRGGADPERSGRASRGGGLVDPVLFPDPDADACRADGGAVEGARGVARAPGRHRDGGCLAGRPDLRDRRSLHRPAPDDGGGPALVEDGVGGATLAQSAASRSSPMSNPMRRRPRGDSRFSVSANSSYSRSISGVTDGRVSFSACSKKRIGTSVVSRLSRRAWSPARRTRSSRSAPV